MDFTTAATTALLAIVGFMVVFAILRWQTREHRLEIDRLDRLHAEAMNLAEQERSRLAERLQYVEFQLANHVAHILKLPPPAPPIRNGDKPEPLPDIVQKFLEAIEDEEARLEYEGDFRARLALGADPAKLVSEAMSA